MSEKDENIISIKGKIVDESDKPIGGVRLTCNNQKTLSLFDGTYSFTDIEPGEYELNVNMEGYNEEAAKINIIEDSEIINDFKLRKKTGQSSVYGFVLDEKNMKPVNLGGSVYLIYSTFNKYTSINPETGSYRFDELAPDEYKIWVSVPGYLDGDKIVEITNMEEKREDIYIRKNEDPAPPWG